MTPITYISEQPGDYAREIDGAETLNKLRSVTADWRELAEDALECANNMTAEDFELFRKGLKKERKGVFAGEKWSERFADILMPALMFKVSIAANDFKVPWGLMYLRLKEAGRLPQ